MNARDIPDSVQWHEGMLLTPQHFQLTDRRHEALAQFLYLAASPFPWGVSDMAYDNGLLMSGLLRVTRLEAVLPDGLPLSLSSAQSAPPELDISPYKEKMRDCPQTVWLAIAAETGTMRPGELARYESIQGNPVPDTNTGEGAADIPRLRARIALLVAETLPAKYTGFPLLSIEYRGEAFSATDYVPPQLRVAANSPIGGICTSAIRRVREKAMFLQGQLKSSNVQSGDSSAENRSLIASLVSGLPAFEALLHSGRSHPFPLYVAFCALAGHISGVGLSTIPPVFTPWDHNRPLFHFREVAEFLVRTIEEGISEKWKALPFSYSVGEQTFQLPESPLWTTRLAKPVGETWLALSLRRPSTMPEPELLRWAESCLIGSVSVIPSLTSRRILGLARTMVHSLEGLVPPGGTILLALTVDPEFVKPSEPLVVQDNRGGVQQPIEAILYVRNE